MSSVKYAMVDMLRCRLIMLSLISYSMLMQFLLRDDGINSLMYMCFGGVILSIQPFMQEQVSESGFINMLPASRMARVAGRFLFGVVMQLMAGVSAGVAKFLLKSMTGDRTEHIFLFLIFFLGIGLMALAIQYTVFYWIGKMKSQQFAGLIMMLPGFALLIAIQFFMENLLGYLPKLAEWMYRNLPFCAVGSVLIGLVLCAGGIVISTRIVEKRDLA